MSDFESVMRAKADLDQMKKPPLGGFSIQTCRSWIRRPSMLTLTSYDTPQSH
jgi:hypothetical protein